jgi:hypothetical protein
MGGCECHRELRADIYAEQLQSSHTGRDRLIRQGQHDGSDMDPVRVRCGCGSVDTLGQAPEARALQHLPRHSEGEGICSPKWMSIECLRYHGPSHEDTLRLPAASLAS